MTTTICIASKFLSTLSLRRATKIVPFCIICIKISIHALLAESDVRDCWKQGFVTVFLSTLSLRRATDVPVMSLTEYGLFLSTLSLRRATGCFGCLAVDSAYFYPRSPCGERLQLDVMITTFYYFYPRSPCGERLTKLF